MGRRLELYSLKWETMRDSFGSRDAALFQSAREALAEAASEPALRQLLFDSLAPLPAAGDDAARPATEAPPEIADAMTALIRAQGSRAGQIAHTSKATPYFQSDFWKQMRVALTTEQDLSLLIARPLCGLAASGLPSWGGLTYAEIARVVAYHTPDHLPYLEDPDAAAMLFDLFDALKFACDFRTDLVSVYL